MILGLVDIGANSIRLSIYRAEDGRVSHLVDKKETAGLSAYVEGGEMSRAGMLRACRALSGFRSILGNFGIADMRAFATASLRNIANTEEATRFIERETGVHVDVLTGAEEARLDFLGGARMENLKDGMLIDIGGGSTELTAFRGGAVEAAVSMPVGSLNLYLKHAGGAFPLGRSARRAIRADVRSELEKLPFGEDAREPFLYGVGGTIRWVAKLANAMFDLPNENREISYEHLSGILTTFRDSRRGALSTLLRLAPERVHTLIPGMIVLKTVARRFGTERIRACGFGVREGYLFDRVLGGEADESLAPRA